MTDITLRKVLRDFELQLSLQVQPGQCLALIGPTGSGKTTTLRLIAGIDAADGGRVALDGQVLLDTERGVNLPPQRRRVGFVFQAYALFPHLTVLQNVMYGIRGRRQAEALAVAREALRRVRLEGVETVRPGHLSGGQQQRVALARALASGAKLLLMDEPMSGLDTLIRRQVRGELRSLIAELGLETIIVTHDVADALTLGDVIGVLQAGKIVQTGTRQELLAQPRTPFVAEFLGVNLLQGIARPGPDGLTEVSCGEHTFYCLQEGEGEVLVTCHPWDLLLSLSAPDNSALNIFRGRVAAVSHLGGRTRVTIEDGISLTCELTHLSAERLGLEPGLEVYAAFKASALRIYN